MTPRKYNGRIEFYSYKQQNGEFFKGWNFCVSYYIRLGGHAILMMSLTVETWLTATLMMTRRLVVGTAEPTNVDTCCTLFPTWSLPQALE
jgi:hypothetical protein